MFNNCEKIKTFTIITFAKTEFRKEAKEENSGKLKYLERSTIRGT